MTETAQGKRYLSDTEKAKIFLKSDFWQECLNTNFSKWGGSKSVWDVEVFKPGSKANIAYHTVVEIELQKKTPEQN